MKISTVKYSTYQYQDEYYILKTKYYFGVSIWSETIQSGLYTRGFGSLEGAKERIQEIINLKIKL